ncbi:hypothetical protein [Streptomyces luteoverticillatus]|uniref:hypothetical protein n=1 Tax=Streptomyces luteoverticillatus TaxID=66425 RepID=UPI001F0BF6D0|nr:hypothetical protein [Streptomyces luteoverticillatus]
MATAVEGRPKVRDPREYVKPEVWEREILLLMRDYPFDEVYANRLFHAAVSYLITAMDKWGQQLEMCCGRTVDIAVHTFILDTRNYREFCAEHFEGRFLEHIPRSSSSTTARWNAPRRSSTTTGSRWTGSSGKPTTPSAAHVPRAPVVIERTGNGQARGRHERTRAASWAKRAESGEHASAAGRCRYGGELTRPAVPREEAHVPPAPHPRRVLGPLQAPPG